MEIFNVICLWVMANLELVPPNQDNAPRVISKLWRLYINFYSFIARYFNQMPTNDTRLPGALASTLPPSHRGRGRRCGEHSSCGAANQMESTQPRSNHVQRLLHDRILRQESSTQLVRD